MSARLVFKLAMPAVSVYLAKSGNPQPFLASSRVIWVFSVLLGCIQRVWMDALIQCLFVGELYTVEHGLSVSPVHIFCNDALTRVWPSRMVALLRGLLAMMDSAPSSLRPLPANTCLVLSMLT